MNKYLIDTNIIIYTIQAKQEHEKIVNFMDKIYDDEKSEILYPVIVEAELFSRELSNVVENGIDAMLSGARIVKVDSVIARKAGNIRAKGNDRGYKIKLPDALIAATAVIEGAVLVTHNASDFLKIAQFEKLKIIDPTE